MSRLRLTPFLALASVACCLSADGATLHYWRFESGSGFLQDSAGSAHLSPSPAASQYTLPVSGPGEQFIGPYPNVGANAFAAAFSGIDSDGLAAANSTPVSGDFTIELFYHAASIAGLYGDALASQAAGANQSNVSWSLDVRLDGYLGTSTRELVLILSDGVNFHAPLSGMIIQPGIDYYVAASFDRTAGQVIYHVKDLTAGTPLQTVIAAHSVAALHPESNFRIGDLTDGDLATHGIIDEVRFSDRVLTTSELLVPEPATLPLAAMALACALRAVIRRAGRRMR